ncbi:sensor histidine kinase [Actinomadura livida]|uniref:histidine kinase n=1 Tax=Actinomadura livida TaxID=79909 RepID=A0A7W7IEW2_9ACTN|nr:MULTISPECIES: sensor histidine kinase [Actinomadura]MBB4775709.1 signal transduction histidine kinase [Actinomadura catellatispora]GGU34570.1 two-component sensor histidine kinase [Actinomadura livida]
MNEPDRFAPGGRPRLLAGVRSALMPGGDDPAVTLLPERKALRIPILLLLLGLTIGFTAGSIAISITQDGVDTRLAWPLGVLQATPLMFAARWPLAAWRVAAAGLLLMVFVRHGEGFMPWPVTAILALIVILFFTGVGADRQTTLGVGAVTITGVLLPAVLFGMPGWFAMILAGLAALALTFGDAVGGRHSAVEELRRREEQHRQDLARQAVLEERARIARELHDVVAHHMSVIAMQAEAAPYKIPDLPDAARQTFGVVRDAAREALTETRRVVGLLRSDGEDAERTPQPGLERLDDLVGAARRSGLSVAVVVTGVPRPLNAGVDLSAYRIVQESLSNASRYAPGSRVHIEVKYGAETLAVSVTDDGARSTPEESQGGGHGLVGMRERVTMLGGGLTAGPQDGAGWSVVAELPYGDPA